MNIAFLNKWREIILNLRISISWVPSMVHVLCCFTSGLNWNQTGEIWVNFRAAHLAISYPPLFHYKFLEVCPHYNYTAIFYYSFNVSQTSTEFHTSSLPFPWPSLFSHIFFGNMVKFTKLHEVKFTKDNKHIKIRSWSGTFDRNKNGKWKKYFHTENPSTRSLVNLLLTRLFDARNAKFTKAAWKAYFKLTLKFLRT